MNDLHVLLPLDGSSAADAAVAAAAALRPSKVTVLHAADGVAVDAAYFDGVDVRLKGTGVRETARLRRTGDATAAILDAAPGCGAHLIALSMHGRSGWDLLRLGSVAEQVLRGAKVPVLALPQGTSTSSPLLDRVLAPQDGSAMAEQALARLLELFPAASAGLELLGIVEAYAGPAKLGGDDVASRFYQLQADDLKERLTALAGRAAAKAVVTIDLGAPATKILDRAAASKATLIAMGTHGRSGLSRWTLGSVTERVLRASPVPVLVLR